jgi:hypothetical protein
MANINIMQTGVDMQIVVYMQTVVDTKEKHFLVKPVQVK